jgi:cystathionine beta-synthase
MSAALKAAKSLKKGQRCVVILPDSVRNYMTKFLSDDWMYDKGFREEPPEAPVGQETWWAGKPVSHMPPTFPITVTANVSCGDTIKILRKEGFDQMPVVDEKGGVMGMVTEGNLMAKLVKGKITKEDPVSKILFAHFKQVSPDTHLGEVSRLLDKDHFILVTQTQHSYSGAAEMETKTSIHSIVTRIDLLNFIMAGDADQINKSPNP